MTVIPFEMHHNKPRVPVRVNGAGPPAAEAGIEAGALLVAFDGVSAAGQIDPIRHALRAAPGRTHSLELRRDDRTFTTPLTLRRMV
jgi:C-terminal processing protease CtpA/Prc